MNLQINENMELTTEELVEIHGGGVGKVIGECIGGGLLGIYGGWGGVAAGCLVGVITQL